MSFSKNQTIELLIDDLGVDGEGIGHLDGYTFFVKGALIGEVIKARVLKANKNFGFAKIEEIVEASPDRTEPVCANAGKCGGCSLMHLSYRSQLIYKENKVKNCLVRIGGYDRAYIDSISEPIIGMEEPYRYRNKAQFPVGLEKDGSAKIGFYAERSHNIIDMSDCFIQDDISCKIAGIVREWVNYFHIKPYNELTGGGILRHIVTRVGYFTGQVMVCLVVTKEKVHNLQQLVDKLLMIPGMTSICLSINKEKTNRIMGDRIVSIYGPAYIEDTIEDVKFRISPLSFYQVNPVQTKKLYRKALSYAELSGDETVWDMYCGIGTISLFLAKKAGRVLGMEIVPQAIEDARENARLNKISNVQFICGASENIEEVLDGLSDNEISGISDYRKPDVIVIDPPRKGCDERLIETIVKVLPERVVYVSCDPATLARDVRRFREGGYELKKVCACDMFGMSGHVETIALLQKIN